MPITVKPTSVDLAVARSVAMHTNESTESVAGVFTWAGDEHVLGGLALAWWLWSRRGSTVQRQASTHVLLTTLVAAALQHLLKVEFNQRRPDRVTVEGHLHGVPLSGKPRDAFPSGHAIDIGALASAASQLPAAQRNAIWVAGGALVLTRIVLLAHWASDVAAGLAIGAAVERLLRPLTGFGRLGKRKHP
jgi:membrane-associated phospholipid phosphatase